MKTPRPKSKIQKKPLAYSYVRFSTLDQQKGDSMRRQVERSERYAAENGLEIDREL
ncbi:MAG: recombinase family protein, partial [Chthoniobacterales bacterium]